MISTSGRFIILIIATSAGAVAATTNPVVNGSFEASPVALTTWTFAPGSTSVAVNCGFNAAVAPGTETLTGVGGFPATAGANIALGSSHQTVAGSGSCTLYQDVAIPVGATTATFSFDGGVIYDGIPSFNAALFAGLYSTANVPIYAAPRLAGAITYEPAASDATLVHQTVTFNASGLAGTTVRLAIIIGTNSTAGTAAIIGVDNVQLQVTYTPQDTVVPTPTLGQWGMLGLAGGLMFLGWRRLRQQNEVSLER